MNSASSDTTLQRISRWTRDSPFFSSLQVRLVLLVLLAMVPAIGLIVYTAFEQRRQGTQTAKDSSLQVVRLAADLQDQNLEAARQLLVTLAQLKVVADQDGPACQALFTNLLQLHPLYANIGAARPDGELFASALPAPESINLSDRAYFREAIDQRDFVIGPYQLGRITKKATVNLGYPVIDDTGALRAVVFAALDLEWLRNLMTNVSLPPGSSMTVSDRERVTLFRIPDPEGKYVGQIIRSSTGPRPPPVDDPTLRPGEGVRPFLSRDGTWRLYAQTRLGRAMDTNAPGIVVGIPLAHAYGPANRTLRRNLIYLGLVTVAAMAAAWYVGNLLIVRRVHSLLKATARLGAGDLKARTLLAPGRGELHQLARAFDDMADSLEQRVAERERAQAQLQSLNEELEERVAERTRELQRSNEDLEQFAYAASHDLQEPLRMVTNYLQLLRQRYQGKLDASANEFIGFALDGAERMQKLIVDLLAYSRLGTKGAPFAPVSCEQVLERARKNLALALEESGATITHDALPTVWADSSQLAQLFQNLIANAVKFRGSQPPRVHIRAERKDGDWQFVVRDNGIGINPKDFSRIFVIFQRLHSREKYPGTGIGLALCKKIVERHGGQLWVESDGHNGATFFFTLPGVETT